MWEDLFRGGGWSLTAIVPFLREETDHCKSSFLIEGFKEVDHCKSSFLTGGF